MGVITELLSKKRQRVGRHCKLDYHGIYWRPCRTLLYLALFHGQIRYLPWTIDSLASILAKCSEIAEPKPGNMDGMSFVSSVRRALIKPTPSVPLRSNQLNPVIVYFGCNIFHTVNYGHLRREIIIDEPVLKPLEAIASYLEHC